MWWACKWNGNKCKKTIIYVTGKRKGAKWIDHISLIILWTIYMDMSANTFTLNSAIRNYLQNKEYKAAKYPFYFHMLAYLKASREFFFISERLNSCDSCFIFLSFRTLITNFIVFIVTLGIQQMTFSIALCFCNLFV